MEPNTNLLQRKIEQSNWIIQIKEGLGILQQQEEEEEFGASVFNVPKELMALKPEAYIPQSVSIGPYHHWRSELYDMQRYKLASARRFEKRINERGKFQSVVVEEFKKHDWQIRSCYHKFIDYNEESLAWLMSLDAVFLLECLQFYVRHANKASEGDFKELGRVLDLTGTSAAHNSIVRDVMMLENQLPLFLLQKLLELKFEGSKAKAEESLSRLLRLVCQELSPFTFRLPDNSNLHINERGHVLEVLYYAIVPVSNNQNRYPSDEDQESDSSDTVHTSTAKKAFSTLIWKVISSVNVRPLRLLTQLHERTENIKPLTRLVKKDTVKSDKKEGESDVEKGEESVVKIKPPTRDKLTIPTVADLHSAGVKFVPTDGDLATIQFDKKTATLYLPRVKLDTNTEVVLRNLMAFEASAAPGALVFTRYTEFMNGLIDHKEDVRLLRENGIISNYLKGDGEVARLWNSMGRSGHLTKVEFLDKVIEDVNTYYNRKWKVVAVKYVKEHIFGSWQFLTLIAAVILLGLSFLQSFCSVYECKN